MESAVANAIIKREEEVNGFILLTVRRAAKFPGIPKPTIKYRQYLFINKATLYSTKSSNELVDRVPLSVQLVVVLSISVVLSEVLPGSDVVTHCKEEMLSVVAICVVVFIPLRQTWKKIQK